MKIKLFCLKVALLTVIFAWGDAFALCEVATEAGAWRNDNPHTKNITRVEIQQHCNDLILIPYGKPRPEPKPPFSIELWGSCVPTDCYWGQHPASDGKDGWIRATIEKSWVTRNIWIKVLAPDYLRVWIWTDFIDPNRKDYSSDNYFHPEACEIPVCDADPFCCNEAWDNLCASASPPSCKK